jgi:hypothetical protein
MRHVSLCLVTLFVCAACNTEPETTIQVQGTVTAADDGSPIASAGVVVSYRRSGGFGNFFGEGPITQAQRRTRVKTNNQGYYSLSFIEKGYCSVGSFTISASARSQGFQTVFFRGWGNWGNDATRVGCTDEPQTIDFQLERETT